MKSLLLLAIMVTLTVARPQATPDADAAQDASLIASISSAVSSASLKPYATPLATDEIKEWAGLGDSFTAGIGSNGESDLVDKSGDCSRYKKAYPMQMNTDTRLPGDPAARKLNFGACSGNKMQDLLDNQLSDNAPKNYVNFGNPQLAVVTITGNDLDFEAAINSCIIRAHGWPDIPECDSVLTGIEQKVTSTDFLEKLDNTFLAIVAKGRTNGGANPPESFQLYVNGYIPFWNEVDTGCDTVSWEWWWATKDHFLTTELRKRINNIVRDLNFQIKRSAFRLADQGVIYVEGFQDSYTDHQFCDPKADTNLAKPTSPNTWFWGRYSPWDNNSEGPTTGGSGFSLPQEILNALVPDSTQRVSIQTQGQDPSQFSDAFTSKEKFEAALDALASSSDPAIAALQEKWRRIFHPKGTAYSHHSDVNLNTILAHRQSSSTTTNATAPDCQKGSSDPTLISQQDLQACDDDLDAMGDNASFDNCCGGGAVFCGPFLALNGTATVTLCGDTEQCIGCARLANYVEGIINTCMVNGNLDGATQDINEKPGLHVQIGFNSHH